MLKLGFLGFLLTLALFPHEAMAKWIRADTENFIIYSEGNEKSLREFAERLQRFDAALRWRFGVKTPPLPSRLTIYLLPTASDVGKMATGKSGSSIAGFYRSTTDGSIALSHRDAKVIKNTSQAQQVLFHEYSHHFMKRYTGAAFPSWFIEGLAEFFSTVDFTKDGRAEVGKPVYSRAFGLLTMPKVPAKTLLIEQPGAMRNAGEADIYYGRSWLLTHMLYSDPAREGQLKEYIDAINRGDDPKLAATSAFGDLGQLDKDLDRYMRKPMSYRTSDNPMPVGTRLDISALTPAEEALLPLRLERVMGSSAPERIAAALDGLRRLSLRHGDSAAIWFELASAEWDMGSDNRDLVKTRNAVERALAIEASHVRANVLLGQILTEEVGAKPDAKAEDWNAVRKPIIVANRTDPDDPVPLLAYFRSFTEQGRSPPPIAIEGLATALFMAPENDTVRLSLAFALANEGKFDKAIELVKPIAFDPHDKTGGDNILKKFEEMRDRHAEQRLTAEPEAQAEAPGNR